MFSIVTPTYNRNDGRLARCIQSVVSQSLGDCEHIIVDDGSTDGTKADLINWWTTPIIRDQYAHVLRSQSHQGRVIARNKGMEAAQRDWICWLDSDDAYDPMYLATLAYHIRQKPDVKLWVLGAIVHRMIKDEQGRHVAPAYTRLRQPWLPANHLEHFPSGKVGTGMFVFHRSCLDKTGLMPPWKSHLEVADGVDTWLGYETGYSAEKKWVGNPWGDDWAMFRHLTQFYQPHKIDACLYVHYVR